MSKSDDPFYKALEFIFKLIFNVVSGALEIVFPQFNWGSCLGIIVVTGLTMFCCWTMIALIA